MPIPASLLLESHLCLAEKPDQTAEIVIDRRKRAKRAGRIACPTQPLGVGYTFATMDTAADESTRFQLASDQSLLVCFGHQITLEANEKVRRLLRLLELEPVAGVRNLHPAYCSLLIKFDALRMEYDELKAILRRYLKRLDEV